MHFSKIATFAYFATGVLALPSSENNKLSKRTCFELTGKKLKLCQEACKVTCDAVTGTIAKNLCKKACDAGPLKVRDEHGATGEANIYTVVSIADINSATADELVEAAQAISPTDKINPKRANSHEACIAACEVLCNSTVLALEQKKCLAKCKPKCH